MDTLFTQALQKALEKKTIPLDVGNHLLDFYKSYCHAVDENTLPANQREALFCTLLNCVLEQVRSPHPFGLYHQKLTDSKILGLQILGPLIRLDQSTVTGLDQIDLIEKQLKEGENVILFGNHQIEPDPQMIYLLLEPTHPFLAEQMIFVAGHRVTTDVLTIPFSLGCNLLCIYSKRHIEDSEQKEEQLRHNQQTMRRMQDLLSLGGQCIYVAPSGGRDRPNEKGELLVAPFDPQSIEMFRLIAKKAGKPTHFYPLALSTFDLLPPPQTIQKEIGEARSATRTPIHLAIGPELDLEKTTEEEHTDRKELRQIRSDFVYRQVVEEYNKIKRGA